MGRARACGAQSRGERLGRALGSCRLAGLVVIGVNIAAWLWEIANGDDGEPYAQLCAVAVAFLRWRS